MEAHTLDKVVVEKKVTIDGNIDANNSFIVDAHNVFNVEVFNVIRHFSIEVDDDIVEEDVANVC